METWEVPMRREVLDHGYIALVETWGSDQRIVEAARMSTGKGFKGWGPKCDACENTWPMNPAGVPMERCDKIGCSGKSDGKPGDEKLLSYLQDNRHMTPFEMAGAIFEVQAPIFVFREWHRHRTQSYNEASARYEPLPDVNYVPTVERLMMGGGHLTKQAGTVKGAAELTAEAAERWREFIKAAYVDADIVYRDALEAGVPKELARVVMPVGRFSKMRASSNLRNWMQFLTLRDDAHAQWEIRQYAAAVREMLEHAFPRSMALFTGRSR